MFWGDKLVEQIKKEYDGKVNIYFRHFPLPMHGFARTAAKAAEAAGEQGKFWEIHDLIFRTTPRDTVEFLGLAERIGVDKNKLLNCLRNSSAIQNQIGTNISQLNASHVNVTPTLIVDGTQYYGEFSFEKISEYFDEIISRKQTED